MDVSNFNNKAGGMGGNYSGYLRGLLISTIKPSMSLSSADKIATLDALLLQTSGRLIPFVPADFDMETTENTPVEQTTTNGTIFRLDLKAGTVKISMFDPSPYDIRKGFFDGLNSGYGYIYMVYTQGVLEGQLSLDGLSLEGVKALITKGTGKGNATKKESLDITFQISDFNTFNKKVERVIMSDYTTSDIVGVTPVTLIAGSPAPSATACKISVALASSSLTPVTTLLSKTADWKLTKDVDGSVVTITSVAQSAGVYTFVYPTITGNHTMSVVANASNRYEAVTNFPIVVA